MSAPNIWGKSRTINQEQAFREKINTTWHVN